VADQLKQTKADIKAKISSGSDFKTAIRDVLQEYVKKSKAVLFEGNNYSQEWLDEAAKRGLPNIKKTPEALEAFIDPQAVKMFSSLGIMSEIELDSWYKIKLERYIKDIEIEARTLLEMVETMVIPAGIAYQNQLLEAVKGLKQSEVSGGLNEQRKLLEKVSGLIGNLLSNANKIKAMKERIEGLEEKEAAKSISAELVPLLEQTRGYSDELELLVDDNLWPLPKYREILFLS